MIGYKIAKVNDTRVVVTLEIPEDALTNIHRNDIVNVNTAKHRTNKAKVIKINDSEEKEYSEAVSFVYDKKSLIYKVNETFIVEDYDTNIEKVCSSGIHFFLTKRCAELHGLEHLENGLYQAWHDNGQKYVECNYINGKTEGLYQEWYRNGQIKTECNYVNDKQEGLYQYWHANGQKMTQCNFVNGKVYGLFQQWDINGNIQYECYSSIE